MARLIGAHVYNSANITITHNTLTALTFDSERSDPDGFHSTVSNTGRLTVPSGGDGHYIGAFSIAWAAGATGWRQAGVRLNAGNQIARDLRNTVTTASTQTEQTVPFEWDLVAGDYVEVVVRHNQGTDLDILNAADYSPEFWMRRVG